MADFGKRTADWPERRKGGALQGWCDGQPGALNAEFGTRNAESGTPRPARARGARYSVTGRLVARTGSSSTSTRML